MKKLILFTILFITSAISAQSVTGDWYGLLKFPGGQLRINLHVNSTDDGYSVTMDSPDQGANGIPVQTTTFKDNKLTFAIPQGAIKYEGTYKNETIEGTFTQNGQPLPLNFSREKVEVTKAKRPQEPKKPYPYYTEEVKFTNEKAGIQLAGTLSLPKATGNFPAVVLVSGSGPQNRDEEILEHKPFLVLADYLTRNGIAVLRYDDRGVGESEGKFSSATTKDFAEDAEAAFKYLKSRLEIDKNKIGIIGHSEGGTIAPIVASENEDVAFIVMLAGTAIPGDEILMLQNYLINKAEGMPDEELTKLGNINMTIYNTVKQEKDSKKLKEQLSEIYHTKLKPVFIAKGIPESQVNQYITLQINEISSPWYSYFIRYNPAPAIEKVQCPILALNGENDLQVPADANLGAIKDIVKKSGNKNVTVKELPGLNHLFQESKTGAPSEYGNIEQTIAPIALEAIVTWINNL